MPRDYLFKDGDERPIPGVGWGSAAVIAVILATLFTAGWEMLWRSRGYEPSYMDGPGLWAIHRHRSTEIGPDGAIIIGSSRILFDTDLDAFRDESGKEVIQLAMPGTNPRFYLTPLANDPSINGLIVVGVTPGLFYLPSRGFFPDATKYYENESPSQWTGQRLSMLLEPRLAFIDNDNLPLFTLLERIRTPNREGAKDPWMDVFKLANVSREREFKMWERVRTDSAYGDHARLVWKAGIDRSADRPAPSGDELKAIFDEVKENIEKIRARGGDVVFVRCPSTEAYRVNELAKYPREMYWDSLLTYVDAVGVHFEDYPEMQGLEVPEWSHLAAHETPGFTRAYARALKARLEDRRQRRMSND